LESLSTYTLDVNPFTFVATLSSNNLSISDQKGLWNFGDGTISTNLSAKHSYTWPGVYNVTFYGYTSAGNTVQACRTFQVTAFNYVGDFIHSNYLNDEKIASYSNGQISDPIEIVRYNSWQSFPSVSATGYTINFYASGSRSDYLEIEKGRDYFGDFDPFGDFDLLFGASKSNLKIAEVPIRYKERVYGDVKIERFKHGLLLFRMSWIAFRGYPALRRWQAKECLSPWYIRIWIPALTPDTLGISKDASSRV
jgi:hypothetical protein